MTTIGIIGGHGKIALLTAPLLVQDGDTVISVIRKEDQVADIEETGARALVRDVMEMSTDEMAAMFSDHDLDAVVWSAGAGGGDDDRTWSVDRDAAIRSMDAAEQAGVKRYVMVSFQGASLNHTVPRSDGFYAYAQAKAEADQHLRESGLDWTLLGPTALSSDEPTGEITVTTRRGDSTVSRANVARVIRAVLRDPSTVGKAIPFVDGKTMIGDAVAQAPDTDQLA